MQQLTLLVASLALAAGTTTCANVAESFVAPCCGATDPQCTDLSAVHQEHCCGHDDATVINATQISAVLDVDETVYDYGLGFDFLSTAILQDFVTVSEAVGPSWPWPQYVGADPHPVSYQPLFYFATGYSFYHAKQILTQISPAISMFEPEQYIDWYYENGGKAMIDAMLSADGFVGILAGVTDKQNVVWLTSSMTFPNTTAGMVGMTHQGSVGACKDYLGDDPDPNTGIIGITNVAEGEPGNLAESLSYHHDSSIATGRIPYEGNWCENFGTYFLLFTDAAWNALSPITQDFMTVAGEAAARKMLAEQKEANAAARNQYNDIRTIPQAIQDDMKAWFETNVLTPALNANDAGSAAVRHLMDYVDSLA